MYQIMSTLHVSILKEGKKSANETINTDNVLEKVQNRIRDRMDYLPDVEHD